MNFTLFFFFFFEATKPSCVLGIKNQKKKGHLLVLKKFLTFLSRKVLEAWHRYPEHLCNVHTKGAKVLSRSSAG